ncbi:MAG: polysaccharide biosynthesis/export family protein [Rhizorhabdus sp.]
MTKQLLNLGILGALALSGCAGSPQLRAGSSAVTVSKALPPPDTTVSLTDFTTYRIGPRDELIIDVLGAPDLSRTGEVDAAGGISLPIVGTVPAGGKTPSEVSELIATRLRGRYVNDPMVSVSIKKAAGQMVSVDGAVREPGKYPVVGGMTLQEAIASAKGAEDLANLDNVVIFRRVSDQRMAALFSLKQIRAGRAPDPQIYPNDIVVVGENATRRFMKDLSSVPMLGSFIPFAL